jgi:small subunit ribosomal protein S9
VTEPTSTEQPEEGQPVTTPEPTIEAMEAVEEAAVEAETEAGAEADTEVEVEVVAEADADVADDYEAEVGTAAEIPVVFTDRPVQTVGRRKEAVVRVRLMPGTGKFTLNGKSLETYFPNKLHQQLIREPLVTVEKTERFDIFANLQGGGTSGQAGALRLAIARALIEVDAEDRPPLKRAGFLTRDARATERKKYGLKKARKAPQYSKR